MLRGQSLRASVRPVPLPLPAKQVVRRSLASVGWFVPTGVGRRLAAVHDGFRHLLSMHREFRMDDYQGDISIQVDPKNGLELRFAGSNYEPEVLAAVDRYVREGDVCIDIGANVGGVGLPMARQAGATGRVHCFEPGPPFVARLRSNLALNPELALRVEVHPIGLSHEPGELHWSQDPSFPGNGGFTSEPTAQRIEVSTLDRFTSTRNLERVDFIKMDTEGWELSVCQGGVETLRRYRPTLLIETLMEFDGPEQRRRQLVELLSSLGYKLYDATPGNPRPVHYPDLPPNALALPDKRLP